MNSYPVEYDSNAHPEIYKTAISGGTRTSDNRDQNELTKKETEPRTEYHFDSRVGSEHLVTTKQEDLEPFKYMGNPVTSVKVQTTPAPKNNSQSKESLATSSAYQIPTKKAKGMTPHNVACKLRLRQEIKDFQNKQK